MTDSATLLALVDRVEALEGPCRETDAEIYQAQNPHMKQIPNDAVGRFFDPNKTSARTAERFFLSGGATGVAPRFTASLDAAMTLVPEGWSPSIGQNVHHLNWAAFVQTLCTEGEPIIMGAGNATTPALALTAAALRALAATKATA
jgi:hypothetical protein